jgi:4-amino-4-deoxy-L-arabinose transferase-like glycosyltransferase
VSEAARWWWPALAVVGGITAVRLVLLLFNETDLFVDESQYWLWGQEFAFGYYSKPPLIAWVIGGVTWLAGSDATFWVRAPGAVLHGVTALVLGALGHQMLGGRAGLWVAASYVTLPLAAVGSLLISTDTIMAPFFAGALYAHARLVAGGRWHWAVLAGALAGVGFLAKYAAVYFLLGVGLGALLIPALRIRWRDAGLMMLAFGAVIAPNVVWNISNGMTTALHTLDNAGMMEAAIPWDVGRMAEFFASQFAVFGPVLFAALIVAAVRWRSGYLWVFIWPVIALICWQALTKGAYANWAVAAYFAGTVVAVGALMGRPVLLGVSLALNGLVAVALPVLTLMPEVTLGRDRPVLERYLGRESLSRDILAASVVAGGVPVVAARRDVLADLFYTGRAAGISIYAQPFAGRARNHYEQVYPLPSDMAGKVLFVTDTPPRCDGVLAKAVMQPDLKGSAYEGMSLAGYVVEAGCIHAIP